ISKSGVRARTALGVCQVLLAFAVAWSAYALADSLPNWPINPLLSKSAWFNFQMDLMRSTFAILPAALLWGASFPLALAAVAQGQDSGKLVGEVYAANTIGGILGALGFAVVFIPWIGSQDSQRLLIALSAAAACIVFFSMWGKAAVVGAVSSCAAAALLVS